MRGVRTAIPVLSESAAAKRSPEERLYARSPALYRGAARAMMMLPPRARRRQLARSLALIYAAANRRDFQVILSGLDPDAYEYRPSPDMLPPDMDSSYHGREGYRRFWRLWLDAFPDIRWDPEELDDLGERFLVVTWQSGHGSGSGLAVRERVFQLFTMRDGLVLRQEDFHDRARALEAASTQA